MTARFGLMICSAEFDIISSPLIFDHLIFQ
jgi:hypothetical protein